jgi:hypothetical protein
MTAKLAVTVTALAGMVKVVVADVALVIVPDGAVQLTNWYPGLAAAFMLT